MTPSQQYHLDGVLLYINDKITAKYTAGAKQHGGNLWEKRLIGEVLDEVADLVVYVTTLKNQLDVVGILAEEGASDDSVVAYKARESCRQILEILNGKHSQ